MGHTEGNTPGRTPETRTRLAHFRAPQFDGSISYGDEAWPIVNGVVECPLEVGEGAGWLMASAAEIAAFGDGGRKQDPPPAFDPAVILAGTVPEVQGALESIADAQQLDALEAAETADRKRKGVLDAIKARLEVLTKP